MVVVAAAGDEAARHSNKTRTPVQHVFTNHSDMVANARGGHPVSICPEFIEALW